MVYGRHLKKSGTAIKIALATINVILIVVAVTFSLVYSNNLKERQENSELETFYATVESMKQISYNYLQMELGYARDWAKYIDAHDMTVDEAIDYINSANNQNDRYAHIVNMNTYEAYSTYKKNGSGRLEFYQTVKNEESDYNTIFLENMSQMFSVSEGVNILGKYRPDDTQMNVISVGTRVALNSGDGSRYDYLLLRVIPVESIRNVWVFPVEYKSAEVGIITKTGDYVIQSKAMKSRSFCDFIRGYNFENDYNKVDELYNQLGNTDKGLLKYNDSKGEECYWYYSSFGDNTGLDILGYIPVNKLASHKTDWTIVIMICGLLLMIGIIDGAYILHINRRLREAVVIAKSASEAKTKFLSTMSHDIRTPMNGIVGMTNLAKSHIGDSAYIRNCLDKISLTSDHLLTLINDILDISKVESGNMTLTYAPFSIERSIAKLVNIIQPQMKEKNQVFDVETDLPYKYLVADELRLNQIYINILTNAVKYTPDGGYIKMSVIEQAVSDDRVKLIYEVTDTGIGMTEQFQANMYSMFVREADGRTDKIQGSGLGLAIVKQMVELMNGTIECESEPDKGTKFTVTIELDRANQQEKDDAVESDNTGIESNDFSGMRIIIAEDNDINWEIINEQLKMYNVECDRAENGRECIDMLEASEEGRYSLVFMDVNMPVMNGKDAARLIRQSGHEHIKNIPIYAMTADAFSEDIQECIDAGMNGHIAKPIEMKKVLDVLRKVKVGGGNNP